MPKRVLQFSQLGKPHQYTTISAGSSGRVFYFEIPKKMVAFLKMVANNWYDDTYFTWIVDGEIIDPKVERAFGLVDRPKIYDPPILVKNYIEWIAYNNSSEDQIFEVMCDGIVMDKKGGKP